MHKTKSKRVFTQRVWLSWEFLYETKIWKSSYCIVSCSRMLCTPHKTFHNLWIRICKLSDRILEWTTEQTSDKSQDKARKKRSRDRWDPFWRGTPSQLSVSGGFLYLWRFPTLHALETFICATLQLCIWTRSLGFRNVRSDARWELSAWIKTITSVLEFACTLR